MTSITEAGWCAFAAADQISGRFIAPIDDIAEDHETCRQIAAVVLDAIMEYAIHEAKHGPVCRMQMRDEATCRALRQKEESPPF